MTILRWGRGPVGVALLLSLLLPGSMLPAAEPPAPITPYFADRAFADVWNRIDAAIVHAGRSWYWGPVQVSGPLVEQMDGLPGNRRLVQYFDKSRMEINDPNGDPNSKWFVTNGLLTVELISGRMQVGVNPDRYEMRAPAEVAIAGDTLTKNPDAPTYASFATVTDTPRDVSPAEPDQTGRQVVLSVSRSRPTPRNEGRYNRYGVYNAYYAADTQHNIPGVFWQFLNARGSVVENGRVVQNQPLSTPWYFATGYPISEAYWASVLIDKQPTDVLIQAYQRRLLTYIPSYSDPWKVQMGNIGQHYVEWRYPDGLPGQARVYDPTGNGGEICRGGLPAGSACPAALADQSPNSAAYRDDMLRTRIGGTLGAQTRDAKFRLLSQSQMQIKWRTDLDPGQNFLFSLGEVLYDIGFHRNDQDEIVVDTGSTGVIRVAPQALAARALAPVAVAPGHLYLSLGKSRDGRLKVGAYRAAIPLVVAGQRLVLPADQQIHVAPGGARIGPEPLDAATRQLWATFSNDGALDRLSGGVDPFDPASCRIANPLNGPLTAAQRARLGCAVEPIHEYGSAPMGPAGSYGNPAAPTLLFSDTLSTPPTLYALTPQAARAQPPTWNSYTAAAAAVLAGAGPPVVICSMGRWSVQRFAGGALIRPPKFDAYGCDPDPSNIYVLYQDGTWEPIHIVD